MMRTVLLIATAFLLPNLVAAQEWTQHLVTTDSPRTIHAGDIDNDGDIDVVAGFHGVWEIQWWENDGGNGTNWDHWGVSCELSGAWDVYAADTDGDGDLDVLAMAATYEEEGVWLIENIDGIGVTWSGRPVDLSGHLGPVCATDMDLDGDMDILVPLAWWENVTGMGDLWDYEHIENSNDSGVSSIIPGDIDSDGDPDVIGVAYDVDEIRWWENIYGAGTVWAEHVVVGETDNPRGVYPADMDGDGDVDLVGAVYDDDDIIWCENVDGIGMSWYEHMVDGEFDGARSVHAADIDGDGDIDLVGAAYLGNEVTWWENIDGMGTTWIEHNLAEDFAGAYEVYAEDMDGDGAIDVLGASLDGSGIAWWENPMITGAQDLTRSQPPSEFTLSLAYPNPFNPTTSLTVELPKPSELTITVYNASGHRVANLASGIYELGTHDFTFEANNVASGIYFIQAIVPGKYGDTQKIVLVR